MRKRSRGRSVANRGGGRGASAGSVSRSTRGGKPKHSPFPIRQSSPPSSTIKFITRDSGPPPLPYLNGAHTRNLQQQQQPPNGELKRNGLAVNSFASIMETATAAVQSADFYLHKKFKKVSSVADDQQQDAEVETKSGATVVDRKRKNGIVAPPPSLMLEIANNLSKNSEPPPTSTTSFFSTSSSISSSSNGLVTSVQGPEPTVYKPKFHKLLLSEEPMRKLSYDSRLAAINEGRFQPFATAPSAVATTSTSPSKARIDRQSLDDRISKIIDENQSILATLPEYSARRKSHHNSGGSSSSLTSSPRNSRSSLSGSGSVDYDPPRFSSGGAFDLSMRKTSEQPKPKTILVRSQSDLSESLVLRNLHLMSPSPSSLSLPSSDSAGGKYAPDADPSFVVPKKRRKLSPAGVFCGGEVSEVKQEEVKYKPSQDVDMTVRVSNCSGAKVTVRATSSTASATRKLSLTSSGGYVSVMGSADYKIITEQPSRGLSSFSPLISPNIFAQEQVMDLKVKGGGRSISKNGVVRKSSEPPLARVVAAPARKFSALPGPMDLKMQEQLRRDSKPGPPPLISLPPLAPPKTTACDTAADMQQIKREDPPSSIPKRPTFLPLRPVNQSLKKSCFDSSLVLPSPDTPRGAKPTNQVYNNGHAYTYLGFKVSTRSSYTCLFRPQPMFVPQENDPKLSMYSNWQPRPKDPNAPLHDLSTNDSRVNNKTSTPPSPPFYSTASSPEEKTMIVSSSKQESPVLSTYDGSSLAWVQVAAAEKRSSPTEAVKEQSSPQPSTSRDQVDRRDVPPPKKASREEVRNTSNTSNSSISADDEDFRSRKKSSDESSSSSSLLMIANRLSDAAAARSSSAASSSAVSAVAGRVIEGGFESNEDYTYVRGRGRGRYVCVSCGIRCKKPSMLRKHLKTHTDLRPYTCKLCNFSFKTKGNLTKHQKSKSHHKKCFGLGIDPKSSQSLASTGPTSMMSDDEEDEDDSDDDEDEEEEEEEDSSSQDSFEKEIAQSLLDLSRVGAFQQQQQREEKPKFSPPATSSTLAGGESPIDLSTKNGTAQKPSTVPELKLDGIRPIGLVAEAQRWEEDELANGCLNLTKVLNKNMVDAPPQPPIIEFKVEKKEEQTQKMVATVRPYEFEITRRRLSKSCSDINPPASSSSSKAVVQPPPSSQKPKLHQPWLSPTASAAAAAAIAEEEDDEEDSNGRDRTESYSSSESKDDLDNNNVEASTSHDATTRSADLLKKPMGLVGVRPQAEFREPSGAQAINDGGKAECTVCGKVFARGSQLTLHMNIHYLERPFRCDPCGVSFRTKGHLIKHRRSSSHDCKVYLTEAWGVANEENPRPFKCADCKIAFRIHGHLAKHLRSKMHIMRMECLGKLPFGIYFEMEKSGLNLNEIDTTDCDMSLVSLQTLAKKIYGESWEERLTVVPDTEAAVQ